jgi:hypothetical protein
VGFAAGSGMKLNIQPHCPRGTIEACLGDCYRGKEPERLIRGINMRENRAANSHPSHIYRLGWGTHAIPR